MKIHVLILFCFIGILSVNCKDQKQTNTVSLAPTKNNDIENPISKQPQKLTLVPLAPPNTNFLIDRTTTIPEKQFIGDIKITILDSHSQGIQNVTIMHANEDGIPYVFKYKTDINGNCLIRRKLFSRSKYLKIKALNKALRHGSGTGRIDCLDLIIADYYNLNPALSDLNTVKAEGISQDFLTPAGDYLSVVKNREGNFSIEIPINPNVYSQQIKLFFDKVIRTTN